jgi:hypothetical protein
VRGITPPLAPPISWEGDGTRASGLLVLVLARGAARDHPSPCPSHFMGGGRDPRFGFARSRSSAMEALIAAAMARKDGAFLASVPHLDVSDATAIVEGSAQKLAPHREEIVARFGAEGAEILDRMTPLARATYAADVERQRRLPSMNLTHLHREVREKYDLLRNALDALVLRKLVGADALAPAASTRGYDALTRSLLVLVYFANAHPVLVADHTRLTREDLEEASAAATRLRTEVTRRVHGVYLARCNALRDRALIALARDYEEVRRMVTCVRWHVGDADELAPSLYRKRPRRARAEPAGETSPAEESTPIAAGPVDEGPFRP